MKAIAFKRNLVIALTILLVGALGVASSGSATVDLDPGLVAYWSFDEGDGSIAHDYSGNGNDGAIYGATWATGVSASALHFDGNDDYVSLDAHVGNLAIDITDDYTISTWLKSTSTEKGLVYQIDTDNGADPGIYVSMLSSGHLIVCVQNETPYYVCSRSDDTYNDGDWYHVAGVYRGHPSTPTVELYINAQFVDDSTGDVPNFSASDFDVAKIGRAAHAVQLHFNGIIDEVRIYNRALSEAEIESLYCEVVRGDANEDGVVDLGDVVYLISYLYRGGLAPDPLCAGDVNCDGIVDLGDVVYLISYLYRGGPPPNC